MKYILLVYSPENSWTDSEWKDCVNTSMGICEELASKNQLISAAPLHPVATGKTVRIREGRPLVTAGPFAETAEQLGGFYLLDVENLDDAIAVASRLPAAKKGTVEIRPLFPIDGLPREQLNDPPAADASLKKFMLICYDDEVAWEKAGDDAKAAAMRAAIALTHELDARGQYLSASPLHTSSSATSVRIRGGKRAVTDGPFAETREVLGGFYLILAKDLDEALQIAARHSGAPVGAVEVRQVFDVSTLNLPTASQLVSTHS